MSPRSYVWRWSGTALILSLFAGITLAVATGAAGKKPKEGGERIPEHMGPKILNAGTDPTLRYPVLSASSWSVKSFSYGWFEIRRNSIRYTVVEPPQKTNEGFDIPRDEIAEVSVKYTGPLGGSFTMLNFEPLQARRKGGRRVYRFVYAPQDRWGKVGIYKLQRAGVAGTMSMGSALSNFDKVLDALVDAPVRSGDLAKVEALLKDNPDLPSYRDKAGGTPLHLAAAAGQGDMAKWLVEKGADVSAKDNAGETPLHKAAWEGHRGVAELLLARGAVLDASTTLGVTPLILAAQNGHREVVELLLAKGAQVNAQKTGGPAPLIEAARAGQREIVELLLAKGADVNAKTSQGETALMQACRSGHQEIVESLLAKGADLNVKTSDGGETALDIASHTGNTQVINLLLAKGADVNAKADDGATPLMHASALGHVDTVASLLAKGAEINAQAKDGATALSLAAQGGYRDVVELLLAKGAEVNAQAKDGATALGLAAQGGYRDVVELLLAKGARVNSPLEPVIITVRPDIVRFINSLGRNIVFFTSREHPISSLSDITADPQFGAWGPGPGASVQDLLTLKQMITGNPSNLLMIGNGHFGNLFQELPQLRLFVTFRGILGVDSIDTAGGGRRVFFVAAGGPSPAR